MSYYHQVLGVPINATTGQIKKAYRRLAKQYHPDRNKSPNAAAKFDEVTKAYDYLTQPQKRKPVFQSFTVKKKPKEYHNTGFTEDEIDDIREHVEQKRARKRQAYANLPWYSSQKLGDSCLKGCTYSFFGIMFLVFFLLTIGLFFSDGGQIGGLFTLGMTIYIAVLFNNNVLGNKPVTKKRRRRNRRNGR